MRKQTKLAVVLSAAALLAMGASMTSFAKGWEQEDGEWVYLDKDGDRVYDAWKKSGNDYYYLNEDGVMATDTVIEYSDGNKYYVDATGKKVTNQWVSVENEDNDYVGGRDDIDVIWYYFGSNGKAVKNDVKTINGKKYIFDENGYMVSGWHTTRGGDLYYLGSEDEGWARTGWQYLEPEENAETYDDEKWFYFGSNGKAVTNKRKYINGYYYTFDGDGVMQDKWVKGTPGAPEQSYYGTTLSTNAEARYTADNGNQQTGWVYVNEDNDGDGDDYWYYLDSKGVPFNYAGKDAGTGAKATKKDNENWKAAITGVAAKVVKGNTYLFNNEGEMLTGVYKLEGVNRVGSSKDLGVDDNGTAAEKVYYFTKADGSAEGKMATGKVTVSYDGDEYTYYFQKDGSAYVTTIADGSYYDTNGERVDANDGNSYQLVETSKLPNTIKVKGASADLNVTTSQGIIVSASGKVKKNGTVKIDGVRYTVENYLVTESENID